MMMKKRFPITEYLEVILTEDDKTEIWIKGEHFMQCSHVLTTVQTNKIENVWLLDSVDDIKEATATIVIDPETRFFVHCSNIQAWVENNFDTGMLHSNLSFPLLKKLIEEECINSMILKEEIAKRFKHGSIEMKRFLFERKYLDSLSKEELSAIITTNFKELLHVLTGSVSKEDYKLFNYLLERSLNEELKKMIIEELAEDLRREDLDMIRFLVDHGHLDSLSLSKKDLSLIIPSNFGALLEDLLQGKERDLKLLSYLLEGSLNQDLKRMVKEELAKILEKGSLETLYFFYRRGYLEYISKERFSAIIAPNFDKLLEDVFRDRVRLSSDRAIIKYLLEKSLNKDFNAMFKKKITQIFEHGVSQDIEYLIKHRFLDYLSKEEFSAIIVPNLSKIVTMLNKDVLSTILTQDVLHHAPINLLKDSSIEFETIMKELIRKKYLQFKEYLRRNSMLIEAREFVNFDILLKELKNLRTSPNLEELLVIIKKEISMILKEDSSTEFFNFLYSRDGGCFNLLNKEEILAIFTRDNLQKIPLKGVDFLLDHTYLYEDDDIKTIVKREFLNGFKQWDSRKLRILIEYNYLEYLSKEDLSFVIVPNLKTIVKELSDGFDSWDSHKFRTFRFLLEYGYADSLQKEELMFEEDNVRCLDSLSIEEASAIIAPNFKGSVEDLFDGDVIISSDRDILDHLLGNAMSKHFYYWPSQLENLWYKMTKEVTNHLIFYNLSLTLFKRYEVVEGTMKNEIRKYFENLFEIRNLGNSVDQDRDEFKKMLGSKTLKDMLKILSIRDILNLRRDEIIDLKMYKEEVIRRFQSRDSDLRNLNDPNILDKLKNTWFKKYSSLSDLSEFWYSIIYVQDQKIFSKSELLQMIPKKFRKIENIIMTLDLNLEIEPYFRDPQTDPLHLYDQNSFLFSVNPTENLVKITIQNYPELSQNLEWIFSELGEIKDVQYIIELWNNNISTLPPSIHNITFTKLIIDGKDIKI